jgi:hypothetical protein
MVDFPERKMKLQKPNRFEMKSSDIVWLSPGDSNDVDEDETERRRIWARIAGHSVLDE